VEKWQISYTILTKFPGSVSLQIVDHQLLKLTKNNDQGEQPAGSLLVGGIGRKKKNGCNLKSNLLQTSSPSDC